jgi:hypothetical protein
MRTKSPLQRRIAYTAVVLAGTLFYGCGIQSKSKYIVNPDLTAKCVYEEKEGLDVAAMLTSSAGSGASAGAGLDMFSSLGGKDTTIPSPHDILLGFASKILSNKGVEAWNDVSFGMIGKDTVYFKGTAYLKNISSGGLSSFDSAMHIYNNDKGQTVIEMKQNKKDTGLTSSANMYKSMFKGGDSYYMMHYYMATFFKEFNFSITYQLPGKIASCSNFTKINDNTAVFSFDGKSMVQSLDTLMQNADMMSKMYSNPSSGMGSLSNTNNILFGGDKPVQIIYQSGNKAQFDYAKEVEDAKIYYADFRKKSGLATFDSIALMKKQQAEFEAGKLKGTLILTAADSANGKIYFKSLKAKQYSRGYIDFTGALSKPVTSDVSFTVSITSAHTDNGMNVLDSIQDHTDFGAYVYFASQNVKDTVMGGDMLTFSISGAFPDDCKYINLEGELKAGNTKTIPFKLNNLYLYNKTSKDGEGSGGWK